MLDRAAHRRVEARLIVEQPFIGGRGSRAALVSAGPEGEPRCMASSKSKPAAETITRLHALIARILDALGTYSPADRWRAASRLSTHVVLERPGKP